MSPATSPHSRGLNSFLIWLGSVLEKFSVLDKPKNLLITVVVVERVDVFDKSPATSGTELALEAMHGRPNIRLSPTGKPHPSSKLGNTVNKADL